MTKQTFPGVNGADTAKHHCHPKPTPSSDCLSDYETQTPILHRENAQAFAGQLTISHQYPGAYPQEPPPTKSGQVL